MRMRLAACWSIWEMSSKRKAGGVPAPDQGNCDIHLQKAKHLHGPGKGRVKVSTVLEGPTIALQEFVMWNKDSSEWPPSHDVTMETALPGYRPACGQESDQNYWSWRECTRTGVTASCSASVGESQQDMNVTCGGTPLRLSVMGPCKLPQRLSYVLSFCEDTSSKNKMPWAQAYALQRLRYVLSLCEDMSPLTLWRKPGFK